MASIIQHIKIGFSLILTTLRAVAQHPRLTLYAFPVLIFIAFIQQFSNAHAMQSYATQIILLYAVWLLRTILAAFIIHQVGVLPGAHHRSIQDSINRCLQKLPLLALWTAFETVILSIIVSPAAQPMYTVLSTLLVILWRTVKLPVIPVIIQTDYPLADSIKEVITIVKQYWIEIVVGIIPVSIMIHLLRSYLMHPGASFIANAAGLLLLAPLFTFAATFKEMVYRHYDRTRELELEELQFPFF